MAREAGYPLRARRSRRREDRASHRPRSSTPTFPLSLTQESVFSASLEIVLNIAYREAVSRRHAYLTLEHLLYALAHDPDGERILRGCGADLPQLRQDAERVPRRVDRAAQARAGARARADRGVPPRAADGRPARAERAAAGSERRRHPRGDPPAAEDATRRGCSTARASRGSTSSNYISHGIAKTPAGDDGEPAERRPAPAGDGEEGAASVARSARGLLREPDRARARRACSIR